jgi:hypothetical protein
VVQSNEYLVWRCRSAFSMKGRLLKRGEVSCP